MAVRCRGLCKLASSVQPLTGITRGGKTISIPSNPSGLAPGINYFFAVLPDARARAAMIDVGERFRKSHRMIGTPVAADSLHLSVCPIGRPERSGQPLEEALLAAAAMVCEQGFPVALDAAMRFTCRDGRYPFVLCADPHAAEAAMGLRKALAAAQASVGLQVSGVSSYLPHVSLLHGAAIDTIEESIAPICWQASEFVLIRSFFGESRFHVVDSWPLASPPKAEVADLMDELANMPDLPEILDDY